MVLLLVDGDKEMCLSDTTTRTPCQSTHLLHRLILLVLCLVFGQRCCVFSLLCKKGGGVDGDDQ
jgi:hypothetical protein